MIKKELQQWLDNFNKVVVPKLIEQGFKPNAINAREGLANLTKGFTTEPCEVAQVLDDVIIADDYNIPVRIFNPNPEEELPVILHFHGGGHMAGSVSVYDPISRRLASKTNHIVVAPEYRLAPENPYPAGIIDGYNSLKNVYKVLEGRGIKYKKEIVLIGDSAGGAMAASISEKAQRDDSVNISKQVLIYPSLDYTMSFPSMEENKEGYLLAASKIAWYFDNYFQNNEDRRKASPLFNEISSKIADTLIFTAQYDPLRDEGYSYVEKLKEQRVYTEHYNLENMVHTFVNLENLCKEECDFVYDKIASFLGK